MVSIYFSIMLALLYLVGVHHLISFVQMKLTLYYLHYINSSIWCSSISNGLNAVLSLLKSLANTNITI